MNRDFSSDFWKISCEEHMLKKTSEYLADHLRPLLKRHETILVCFPDTGRTSLGGLVCDAVHQIGAVPLCCGPDFRWKTLLRQAFQRRATAIFAPPELVLGLAKAARATRTPISIRTVILAGYPSTGWIVDGIRKWLDCSIYGCYTPGSGAVVAGFSCGAGYGIHLRSDVYSAELTQDTGEIVLRLADHPDAFYHTGEIAKIMEHSCDCGKPEVQLTDFQPGGSSDRRLMQLEEQLLTWGSILDYHAEQTSSGVSLEVVVFPREKLPRLPSCAKLTLRPWNPDTDVPFYLQKVSQITELPIENS